MTHRSPWIRFPGWPVLGARSSNANVRASWGSIGRAEYAVYRHDENNDQDARQDGA